VVIIGKRHPLLAPPFETVWEQFAKEGVMRCVEHAEKLDVIFGLEHSPNLFVENSERMLYVINEVKSPAMKIVFDVANASMVEPIEAALNQVKNHLVHVHLSDTDFKKWTHSPIGQGEIDFQAVAGTLRDMAFEGVSILETTYAADPEGGIRSSLERLLPLGWRI
jgi:sugar phosphate isomerase/epimerase